jgi:hypothetical protein
MGMKDFKVVGNLGKGAFAAVSKVNTDILSGRPEACNDDSKVQSRGPSAVARGGFVA